MAKGKQTDSLFSYLAQLEQLVAEKSRASTVEEFSAMEHVEKALAVRAAYAIREVREKMKASQASKKEQENELYALDIARMTRLHLIYLTQSHVSMSVRQGAGGRVINGASKEIKRDGDMANFTFVFEVCTDCKSHQWNTRHDEGKYLVFFQDVASAIKAQVPGAVCSLNKIPKDWSGHDSYSQAVPKNETSSSFCNF